MGRLVAMVCLLTLAGYSQGICPGEKMIYYTRTQSCFLFGRDKRQLFGCRYDCEKLRGGQNGDEMGHRARIMDQETDNFLKGYIGGDNFWIDLSDAGKSGLYIWDSSGEKPSYYGWANEGESTKDYERYVVITKNGWKKMYQTRDAYCLCEVDAEIAMLTVSAPAPLQVGKKAENAITCSFGELSWDTLSWYLPTDSEAARCTLQNGNAKCRSYIKGDYPATISKDNRGPFTSTLVINEVQRYNEGLWRCNIYSGNNMIGQGSTDVRVYEPAKEIQCDHTLTTTGLEVKCGTARIYPEPKCKWEYAYGDDEYASVDNGNAQRVEKNSKYVENSVHFYNATCILRLETDTFDFKAGELALLIAMQPDVTGIDEDTITTLEEHVVKIEKPRAPKFKLDNNTRIGDSLTLVAGEELIIKCFVYHGNPFVYQTSMKCDFAFNGNKGNGQGYSETRQSKSVVVKIQANKDMDGGSCTCSGKHITGSTDSKPLVFYVQSPAEITHFLPQQNVHRVQKVYEYRKGTDLDMVCYFSGNPSPSVTMHHVGSQNKLKTTTEYSKSIRHGMKADCSSNGEYVCEAENTIRGELYQVNKTFSLSVQCAPTPCTSVESNKTFGANIGGDANIHLCLYANPAPTKSFWIYALSRRTYLEQGSYNLDYKPQKNAMGELSVNFKMEEHMFGAYYLYYNGVKFLKFNIVLKGAPFCPTEIKVIDRGLDYLQLQWTPGTSQEVGESYVIHQLGDVTTDKDDDDDGYTSSQLDDIEANETTVRGIVTYTLTGLEHGTTYNLSVGTRNQHGTRLCLDSWFNATTKEDEVSVSSNTGGSTSASWVIVVIVLLLVVFVVVLLIVAIVLWRRKRRQRKLHDISVATVAINLSGTPEEEEEEEGRIVYASVNKNTQGEKKRGQASSSTNASQSEDYGDSAHVDHTYRNSAQVDHTYRNSAQLCADVNVYNNQMQDSAVYVNTGDINKSTADGGGGAGKKKGGDRELVYISVTIDPTKKKVKLNEHGEDRSDKKAKIVEEEEVEYSGLDFTATKLKQKEVEEEERRKKEEEEEEERRRKEEEEEEGGGGMGGERVVEG